MENTKVHVLIVEDEISTAEAFETYLTTQNYRCTIKPDAFDLVEFVFQRKPDIIVLDIMLPGGDGLDICKALREQTQVPIIMLTARSSEKDRLNGLVAGADDYVCKPICAQELELRIRAILRRVTLSGTSPYIKTDFRLNDDNLTASFQGSSIALTTFEFALLKALFKQPEKVFSRQDLIKVIYPDKRIVLTRTVDAHVSKLRKKLRSLPSESDIIVGVYKEGYKFVLPDGE